MKSKTKIIKRILRWALAILCLVYIVRFFYTNRKNIDITLNLNPLIVSLLIALSLIYLFLHSLRFKVIIQKCSDKKLPFLAWFKIFILSRFLNTFFPQAGNLYRGVSLKKNFDISYTRYITAFSSFAWMDTLLNFVIATTTIVLLNPDLKIGYFTAWKILAAICAFLIITLIFLEVVFKQFNFKNPKINWLHSKLSEVLTVSIQNLKDPVYIITIFSLGTIVFVRTCLAFYIYFYVFNFKVDIPALAVFCSLFKLSTFITLTPANIGVLEVTYGYLSRVMNIGEAEGIFVSGLMRVVANSVIIVLGLALGGIDLLQKRKDYTNASKENSDIA